MKILICYFSGTGNTKKIASLYKDTFEMYENEVVLHELSCKQDIPDFQVSEYDLVGIGYPVHAFNAPRIILDLCKAFPKGNKKVFIFKTSGEPVHMNDISSLKTVKMLKRKGYMVTNEYHYIMPYNIIFRHSDAMAYNMWETAKELIPIDVQEILNGVSRHPKKVFCGNLLAWFMRIEHWGAHINGKFYKVVKKNCSACKLCINTCPVKNIKMNKKGKIMFGKNCIMCMRCAFNCPKNAINIGLFKSWKVNGKYSFEMPTQIEKGTKHDKYCKKAYDRYFNEARCRIQEFTK